MDLRDVQVAILAGGLGTRLRSALSDRPKVLAPVAGQPFLCYLLDQLEAAGVREVLLLTGYQGDVVQHQFGSSYGELALTYSREPAPRGTAGAIAAARRQLRPAPLLLLNGDSYCDLDLAAFHRSHVCRAGAVTLAVTPVDDVSRFGAIRLSTRRQVLEFTEKGERHGSGWINAGVYLLDPAVIASLPEDTPMSLEREVFPAWVARGKVFAHCTRGAFLDIGTPESYARAEQFFGSIDIPARSLLNAR